jgi:hypothetical protein
MAGLLGAGPDLISLVWGVRNSYPLPLEVAMFLFLMAMFKKTGKTKKPSRPKRMRYGSYRLPYGGGAK